MQTYTNIYIYIYIYIYMESVAEPELLQSLGKKNCNTFIGVYIRNCKQIIKIFKGIAQFMGVYIRNSEEFI